MASINSTSDPATEQEPSSETLANQLSALSLTNVANASSVQKKTLLLSDVPSLKKVLENWGLCDDIPISPASHEALSVSTTANDSLGSTDPNDEPNISVREPKDSNMEEPNMTGINAPVTFSSSTETKTCSNPIGFGEAGMTIGVPSTSFEAGSASAEHIKDQKTVQLLTNASGSSLDTLHEEDLCVIFSVASPILSIITQFHPEANSIISEDPKKLMTVFTSNKEFDGLSLDLKIEEANDAVEFWAKLKTRLAQDYSKYKYVVFIFNLYETSKGDEIFLTDQVAEKAKLESMLIDLRSKTLDEYERFKFEKIKPKDNSGKFYIGSGGIVFRVKAYDSDTTEFDADDGAFGRRQEKGQVKTSTYKQELSNVFATFKNGMPRYDMSHPKMGYALIFNQITFKNKELGSRLGSVSDEEELKSVLESLGFEVIVYKNKTTDKIKETIKIYAGIDQRDCNCIAVFMLTHGNNNGVLCTYDDKIDVKQLLEPFRGDNASKTLLGKPKLFFLQACRGQLTNEAIFYEEKDESESQKVIDHPVDESKSKALPAFCDILVAYSTVDGYLSTRCDSNNPVKQIPAGTWYIQILCYMLKQFAKPWYTYSCEKNSAEKNNSRQEAVLALSQNTGQAQSNNSEPLQSKYHLEDMLRLTAYVMANSSLLTYESRCKSSKNTPCRLKDCKNCNNSTKKQVPQFESCLTRLFYFDKEPGYPKGKIIYEPNSVPKPVNLSSLGD